MKYLVILWLALQSFTLLGQEADTVVQPAPKRKLLDYFTGGNSHGHFRYYFMATDNAPGLTDYYANAFGGGLGFTNLPFHGFQLGVSGFYIFNVGSSNLAKRDPSTNQLSRYETGQFDIEDLANRHDLDRLEELYLKYNFRKSKITAGRQIIKTPFINPQDGRMRPTTVQGISLEINEIQKTNVHLIVLDRIAPRGTIRWYHIGESIGKYAQGRNIYGEQSDYASNINSKFVAIAGLQVQANKNWKIQAWNYFTDNVFNSALFQADGLLPLSPTQQLILGFQVIRQDVINDGGNPDPKKAYAASGWHSNIFGSRIGIRGTELDFTLNYTRISNDGRFLMPREWGKEPLYTFMQRERNEGSGGVHAVMARLAQARKSKWKPGLALGYFQMPGLDNALLNKYGMPTYWQINGDIKHEFEGFFEGLDAELIVVYKGNVGAQPEKASFVFNKVNMWHTNFIVNYHF